MIHLVANLYILAGNAKTAHWNIQGSRFYGLHTLLDEVDEMLRDHGDKFAERLRYHNERPAITVGTLDNLDAMPDVNPETTYVEQTTAIIRGLEDIHNIADGVRGQYASCEDSMLDVLQEGCGKYIYLLSSILK